MDCEAGCDLNNKLDDLGVSCARFAEDTFQRPSAVSSEYWDTCRSLYSLLRQHDSTLAELHAGSSYAEYGAALSPRGLCFGIGDSDRTFELLNYLATNVQAERLLSYRRNGNRRRKAAEKELSLRSEIVRVYGTLQVSHSDKSDEALLSDLCDHLAACRSADNAPYQDTSRPILSHMELSVEETNIISAISVDFWKDYSLRRRMLLKRLDVTMQSFVWGRQLEGRESEVRAIIASKRSQLNDEPPSFSLSDALAAPISLVSLQVRDTGGPSFGIKKGAGPPVKSIVIGSVPDRGGRVAQIKPKALSKLDNSSSHDRGSSGRIKRNSRSSRPDKGFKSERPARNADAAPQDARKINKRNDKMTSQKRDVANPAERIRKLSSLKLGGRTDIHTFDHSLSAIFGRASGCCVDK